MDISNNLYSNIKVQSKYILQCEENNSTTDQEELREESRIDILYYDKGPSMNYVVSIGGEGGRKLPILPNKKTTKMGEGGQKSPILRQHSLWTVPNQNNQNS